MLCNKSIREDIGWQSHIQTAVPHFVSGLVSCPLKSLIRRDVPNPKRLGKLFNHVQKEPHGPFEVVCSCR